MKATLTALGLLFAIVITGQTPERYSSVRISLENKQMEDLAGTGIETEHGMYDPGHSITLVLSETEIEKVRAAGFQTRIIVADLLKWYQDQKSTANRSGSCPTPLLDYQHYETPENYTYGALGGYLSYAQMMDELDKMHAAFPSLISQRTNVSDTISTWEGHYLQYVRISDNPDVEELEPKILYTALHHAREPNSASQLIFFMWYLLENHAQRADVQAIVDNLELYFIPCVNPDGYLYNEAANPNGGGFWRKNRRPNDNGTYGVDLSRNYAFHWGESGGSSGNPADATYRGPAPFSEPETRSIRDFCLAHDFQFVLNAHASGNLFIYPWDYTNAPADSSFIAYARHFTKENHYKYGTAYKTAGYKMNGYSDDWMLAELGALAFTSEIGNAELWSQQGEIDKINKANLWTNISLAYSALKYGEVIDTSREEMNDLSGTIQFQFTRLGLMDGRVTISLVPVSSNIVFGSASRDLDVPNLATVPVEISYELDPDTHPGDQVTFLVETNYGFWTKRDTITKFYKSTSNSAQETAIFDHIDNAANWIGGWALTAEKFHSAGFSMTDSPQGNYSPGMDAVCTLAQSVEIPAAATSASLRFFTRWDIERFNDYAQVRAVTSAGVSTPLCGKYTHDGTNAQEPIYDDLQVDWLEETMDLSDFIGQSIRIEFHLVSNEFYEYDGFYFDDLRIDYALPVTGVQTIDLHDFNLAQNQPNPTDGTTYIEWSGKENALGGQVKLLVFNTLGETVFEKAIDPAVESGIYLDTKPLRPGIYTYQLMGDAGRSEVMKMAVVR